jgi:thiamine transport system ATP-binding protein
VYRRPASRFVAEFVGDNNVFEGVVVAGTDDADAGPEGSAGSVLVDVGGETVRIGSNDGEADGASSLSPGDAVTFCLRPQHLRVGRGDNGVRAAVENAEFLGETTRVHLEWENKELVVRTEEPLSGTVTVGFDPADAHVIDG